MASAVDLSTSSLDHPTLKQASHNALRCYADLSSQVQTLLASDNLSVSDELYAFETLSESLKLATAACVALGGLDDELFNEIKEVLSLEARVVDEYLQDAATGCASVLVVKYVVFHFIGDLVVFQLIYIVCQFFKIG